MPEPSEINHCNLASPSTPPREGNFQSIIDMRVGVDLIYIPRLKKSYKRLGGAFFLKMLTEAEWDYCQHGHSKHILRRAAARIASKEAVAKALGCGLNGLGWGKGVRWHDIEMISTEKAAPGIQLHSEALKKQNDAGISEWRFSISHDGDYALASVWGLVSALK